MMNDDVATRSFFLQEILEHKREEVEVCRRRRSVDELKDWAQEQAAARAVLHSGAAADKLEQWADFSRRVQ